MKKQETCNVCGKNVGNFNGCVYYDFESYLCRSHYLEFNKYKKPVSEKFKNPTPGTKRFIEMCNAEGKCYKEWLGKKRNGVSI